MKTIMFLFTRKLSSLLTLQIFLWTQMGVADMAQYVQDGERGQNLATSSFSARMTEVMVNFPNAVGSIDLFKSFIENYVSIEFGQQFYMGYPAKIYETEKGHLNVQIEIGSKELAVWVVFKKEKDGRITHQINRGENMVNSFLLPLLYKQITGSISRYKNMTIPPDENPRFVDPKYRVDNTKISIPTGHQDAMIAFPEAKREVLQGSKTATIILHGGRGSRLGRKEAKGDVPIFENGLFDDKPMTLLELNIILARIMQKRLVEDFGAKEGPILVMTSTDTDEAFLRQRSLFKNVEAFNQGLGSLTTLTEANYQKLSSEERDTYRDLLKSWNLGFGEPLDKPSANTDDLKKIMYTGAGHVDAIVSLYKSGKMDQLFKEGVTHLRIVNVHHSASNSPEVLSAMMEKLQGQEESIATVVQLVIPTSSLFSGGRMYNVVMQDGTMRQKLIEDPDVPNELRELAKKAKVPFNTAHYLVNLSRWQKELEEAGGIEKALERVPVAQDKKILKHPVTQEDLYLMKLERRVQDLLDPGTQVTLPSTYTSEAKGASDLYGESYLHVLRKSLADLCPSRGCSQRMLPENFRDKYVKAGLDFDNFQSQLTESYIVLLRLLLGSEKVKKKTIVLNLTNENVLALKSKGRRKLNTMYLIIPYIKKMFLQSRNVGHDFDFVIQLPKTFSQEEVDAFRGFYIGLLKSHGLDSAKWNLILTTDHEQVIKDGSHYVFNAEDFSLSNVYDRLKDTVSRELTLAYSSYKTLEEDVQSIGATEVILKKAFAITTDPVLVRSDTQVPRYATVDDVRAKYLFGTSGYRAHLSRRGLFKVLLPKLLLLLTSAEKELFQIFYLSKDFSDEERRIVEKYFALGHGKMFPYEREAFFTAWTRVSPETKLVLEKVLKNPGTLKDHINIAIENVFYENRRANVGNDALKLLALSSYTDELKEYMQDTVNYGAKEGLNHHGAVLMGQAMARMALKQDVPQIVIGYDTRIESQDYAEEIARAVVAESNGTVTPVIVDGYAATPILSWLMKTKYPKALGVILTPSHNPTEDIGEKPYGKRGIAFVDAQTTELSKTIEEMHTKIAMSAYYYTAPETVLDNEKYVIRLKTRDIVPEYMISLLRNLKASGLLKGDATLAGLAEAFKMQGRSIGVDGKFGMAAGFWPWLKKELKKEGFDRLHTYNMTPGANDFRNFDFGELEPHGDSLVGLDRDDNAIVVGNDPDADRTAVVVKKGRGWEVVDMNTLAAVLTYKKIKTILAEAPLGDGKKGRIVVATTVASSPLAVKVLLHFKEDLEGKGYTIVGINSFPVGYKYFFNTPQTQQTTKGENLFETKGPHDYVLTFEGSGGILAGQGNKDGDQGRDFSHDKDGFFGTLAAILVGDFTEKLEALKKELKIEALFKEKSFPVPPIVGSKHDTYSERKAKLYGYFAKLADEKSGERVNFTRAVKSIIGVEARTVVTVDGLKVFFLGESLRGSFLIRFSGTEEKMRIYAYLEKDVNEEGQHKEVKSELEKNMEEHLLRRIERLYTDFFVPEVLEIKAVTPKLIEKGLVSPVDSRSKLQSEGLPTIAEGLTSLEDNGLTSLVQESFLKKPPGGSPMSVIVNISNFFVDSHEKDKKQLTKEGFILLVLLHSGSIQLEIIMENNVVSLKDIFDKWGILEGVRDKVKITFGKLETPFSPKRFPVLGDITMLKGAMLKKNFDQLSAKRAIDAST